MLRSHLINRNEFANAGVGEENIDPAKTLFDLGSEIFDVLDFRSIGLNSQNILAELFLRRFTSLGILFGYGYLSSFLLKQFRRCITDSGGAARNERYFAS